MTMEKECRWSCQTGSLNRNDKSPQVSYSSAAGGCYGKSTDNYCRYCDWLKFHFRWPRASPYRGLSTWNRSALTVDWRSFIWHRKSQEVYDQTTFYLCPNESVVVRVGKIDKKNDVMKVIDLWFNNYLSISSSINFYCLKIVKLSI